MSSIDLNWDNYVMIWSMIKKITVEEAAADPECKLAYDIQFPPVVVEPTVEPVKKRAYKRKPKVVLSEATVEPEPTVEEEIVAEPEPTVEVAPVVAVKIPKPRVTRKVLRL